MSKGQMSRGFRLLRKATAICRENDCFSDYATMELCQGQVYAQMAAGAKPVKPSLLFKNIGFMLMQFPFAGRRAVKHFNKAAQILMRTDFAPALGNVYFEMGRFYQKKGKKALASENLIKAIQQYKQSEATGYLREAESLLAVLEKNEGKH